MNRRAIPLTPIAKVRIEMQVAKGRALREDKEPKKRKKFSADEDDTAKKEVKPLEPWNFHWVVDGRLAIMACPISEAHVKYILEEGIVHLISLSPERQPPFEYFPSYFRWTPMDVLEFEPPSLEQIVTFIKICEEARKLKEAIGVHCRLGHGRSGVLAACYLVHFKRMHPDRAVMKVRIMSRGAIETYFQERAVWNYYDYMKRTRSPSPDFETFVVNFEIKPYKTVLHRYCPALEPNPFVPYKVYYGVNAQPFEY